ncbi:Nucleolar protein 58 [Nucella lapillus]
MLKSEKSEWSTCNILRDGVKLKKFHKFKDMSEAISSATATIESQISDPLKKMLAKLVSKDTQDELAVADAKLGSMIKETFNIQCVSNSSINELMRCIRSQLDGLVGDKELTAMSLGLAHSLSRYKVKFSPDKVDTMIVQAISTLDDIDKEINNFHMRAREWYSWHFPELMKVVTDHETFIRTVMKLGNKENAATCDLSDILPEEVETDVKEAAEISMGTEISSTDITLILYFCKQIVQLVDFRTNLYEYLKQRMVTIAPNLTVLVGELVGARLISHAGSLVNLAKQASSTVQILGAEKALFRALKSDHATPKYGLIYHASLVGQTTPKNKGKLSRMLAAKCALSARVDALGDEHTTEKEMGLKQRVKLEMRIRQLENKTVHRLSGRGKEATTPSRYENVSEVRTYNSAADSTLPSVEKKKRKRAEEANSEESPRPKKVKKEPVADEETSSSGESEKKKKKKKKKHQQEEDEESPSSKRVKREVDMDGDTSGNAEALDTSGGEKKKKKKKKKSKDHEEDS